MLTLSEAISRYHEAQSAVEAAKEKQAEIITQRKSIAAEQATITESIAKVRAALATANPADIRGLRAKLKTLEAECTELNSVLAEPALDTVGIDSRISAATQKVSSVSRVVFSVMKHEFENSSMMDEIRNPLATLAALCQLSKEPMPDLINQADELVVKEKEKLLSTLGK